MCAIVSHQLCFSCAGQVTTSSFQATCHAILLSCGEHICHQIRWEACGQGTSTKFFCHGPLSPSLSSSSSFYWGDPPWCHQKTSTYSLASGDLSKESKKFGNSFVVMSLLVSQTCFFLWINPLET